MQYDDVYLLNRTRDRVNELAELKIKYQALGDRRFDFYNELYELNVKLMNALFNRVAGS